MIKYYLIVRLHSGSSYTEAEKVILLSYYEYDSKLWQYILK